MVNIVKTLAMPLVVGFLTASATFAPEASAISFVPAVLPDAGYETFALTGNETAGGTLAGFEPAIGILTEEEVSVRKLPLDENVSADNSLLIFREASKDNIS